MAPHSCKALRFAGMAAEIDWVGCAGRWRGRSGSQEARERTPFGPSPQNYVLVVPLAQGGISARLGAKGCGVVDRSGERFGNGKKNREVAVT